jgi:peptide chain release factor 2
MLKATSLRARAFRKRNEEKQALEDSARPTSAGAIRFRSYVLDQSRIKDLRTNVEIGNTQSVLDGDLDVFISGEPEARV